MKRVIFILIIFFPLACFSQTAGDLTKFENLFEEKTHNHKWGDQLKNNSNEISFILSTFFVLYKELLSSQDVDACVFTPSCSVYAIESIKQKGAFNGYFNAIDRLTRCNPGRHKHLPIDLATGKYFDPLE
jgi:putative component of membrane protein insertase Oxa1/YidC/SpoIIIJ protein YidD